MNSRTRIGSLLVAGSNDLSPTIRRSKAIAKRVGVAVDSATSASQVMGELDQVVVVTVNFGFGHQQLFRPTLPKTRRARDRTDQMHLRCALEVERWDPMTTAPLAVAAGSRRAGGGVGISNDEGLRTAATPGVMSCSWR
jgi:ribulose-phosphate 3-epimerase